MSDTPTYENTIRRFATMVREGTCERSSGALRAGVDLGTANIVVAVVDAEGRPVTGAWKHDTVVRDGVVVDWVGATSAVRQLKRVVEERIGRPLAGASVAVPPGIPAGDVKVFVNVLHDAGLEVDEVVDEPVAAARVLHVTDGCVIDVGHGTTGVSVLQAGRVVHSVDQATGGHHMTLVLAGARHLPYDVAEAMKQDPARQDEVVGVIRPTLEKMATIARDAIAGFDPPAVYLVGGASSFRTAPDVFSDVLGRPVTRPVEPLFITPLGVPMTPQGGHGKEPADG
ncbi:MAG: ethanolamine utilization protein EutJ [Actinomycetia bacterium]|nr:ethanolamine utilization protein EutJ [Actinomycetes bacterium]